MRQTLTAAAILTLASLSLSASLPQDRPLPYLQVAASDPPPEAVAVALAGATPPGELAVRIQDGRSILLRAAAFDPLVEGPPAFAREENAAFPRLVLVQFTKDLDSEDWERFASEGARLIESIPRHAYVARVADGRALAALAEDPRHRWHGHFSALYKVDPLLLAPGWTTGVFVDLRLAPEENPLRLRGHLGAIEPAAEFATRLGSLDEGTVERFYIPKERIASFALAAARDEAVVAVDAWFLPRPLNDDSIWVIQSYDTTDKRNYTLSATLWNHCITGTGQLAALCDTGLDDDMCYFRYSSSSSDVTDAMSPSPTPPGPGTPNANKKVAAYYVLPGATAYDADERCNGFEYPWHGTHTTGTLAGDNYATPSASCSGGHDLSDGMAPNARIVFQDAGNEDSGCLDGLATDTYLIYGQAYNAGARIHSDSWGSPTYGAYTNFCVSADKFLYDNEDFCLFVANGNYGSDAQTVNDPGSAKDVVSVGATTNGSLGANAIAIFSSVGPTADGRMKPDVCAPGYNIWSAGGDSSHSSNNCSTRNMSGTSMSTPTAAGGATLLRQYFTDGFYPTGAANAADATDPSGALLKAALVNGAVDISYTTQATVLNGLSPSNSQGWGRMLLDTACFFSTPSRSARRVRFWDKRNATGLKTGDADAYSLQVAAGRPLKVTLVWTDPPGSTNASVQLVNNLDLEVVDPSSTLYKGNVFSGGQSATGGTADALNDVEEVFLTSPAAGTWTLRVKATAVPGTPSEPYSDRQGYALVATYADCTQSLAAPSSLSATDAGVSGIALTWPAVGSATGYQIYRASETCSADAAQFHTLGQATGTTYTDALVQGGFTYAYTVRAVTACSEGPLSPCAAAASTGNCALYPTFSGLVSATNDTSTPVCDVLLSWAAGSSNCPGAASVSYNVYRGATPYFTVGAGSRIAAGVTGTSYRDASPAPGATYYYVVRCEDGTTANGGPANGGNEDRNTVMRSATPTAATSSPGTWTDSGGDGGPARLLLDPPWRVTNQQNHTAGGSLCYHNADDGANYPTSWCASATTPDIPLQAGAPQLSYWARYNFEYQYDGLVVEISSDGGRTWATLSPTPAYPDTLALTGSPPINECGLASTTGCFTGPSGQTLTAWVQYTHDLTAYAGQTVRIRWRFSSDPGTEYDGFYLDDIQITLASVPDSCFIALPETAPGASLSEAQSWPDKISQSWPALTGATSYSLYRGVPADLPKLLDSRTDSCTKYTGSSASAAVSETPSSGSFWWYLVTASNGAGEGPAGNATAGSRAVNSSGACP